jgi:uncharacterized protein
LIRVTELEKRILSSIGFNRLHDVYQNSTAYLTFPSIRTKRFEHSVGTMKICSDMFYYGIMNAKDSVLEGFFEYFAEVCTSTIKEIASNKMISYKFGGHPPSLFHLPAVTSCILKTALTPYNVTEQFKDIHYILVEAIRIAGLLHDVGHPPFSHVVENALYTVYSNYLALPESEWSEHISRFMNTMNGYFVDKNRKLHEQMGDEITKCIMDEVIPNLTEHEARENNFKKRDRNVIDLLILAIVEKIFNNSDGFADLHYLIDSSIDGDRLDYVTRDLVNSGLDYGKIDYTRILTDIRLFEKSHRFYFCVPIKAIGTIENLIKRRLDVYKNIVNHHRVIKTDFLLENVVKCLTTIHLSIPMSPSTEFTYSELIPYNISGLWFPLADCTDVQRANALSQWNDSWLMTMLKQEYYVKYCNSACENYVLSQQMSELLRNKKAYHSMVKRYEDFRVIDDKIGDALRANKTEISDIINRLHHKADELKHKKVDSGDDKASLDISATLTKINELLYNKIFGFNSSFINKQFKWLNSEYAYKKHVETISSDNTKNLFTNLGCCDTIVVFSDLNIGLNKPIYFYDNSGKLFTLDDVSGIAESLGLEVDYTPQFYIYIMVENDAGHVIQKKEKFLEDIGEALGKFLADSIKNKLIRILDLMEG